MINRSNYFKALNPIRKLDNLAAYQSGQANIPLTHVHRSATNPKNICLVGYKHKVFRAKGVKSRKATQRRLMLDCLREKANSERVAESVNQIFINVSTEPSYHYTQNR